VKKQAGIPEDLAEALGEAFQGRRDSASTRTIRPSARKLKDVHNWASKRRSWSAREYLPRARQKVLEIDPERPATTWACLRDVINALALQMHSKGRRVYRAC